MLAKNYSLMLKGTYNRLVAYAENQMQLNNKALPAKLNWGI